MNSFWRSLALAALLLPVIASRSGASDETNFNKSLEYTRAVIGKHHLISLVEIEPLAGGAKTEFRYDRYPEVEQLRMSDGATYARKKGKAWLKSTDWAKTGTKIKAGKAQELDALVSFLDAPLQNHVETRDKSQGGLKVHLTKREPVEQTERLFYELRREKSTGFLYPQFVFSRGKEQPEDQALLIGYAGLMYSGDEKVRVNINYEYLFRVKMEVVKPAKKE